MGRAKAAGSTTPRAKRQLQDTPGKKQKRKRSPESSPTRDADAAIKELLNLKDGEDVDDENRNHEEDENAPFSQSYFRAREASGALKNSTKKVSDLDIVNESELRSALSKVPVKHVKEQTSLLESYRLLYPKWHFQLRCGFGLLMYGFGSKKSLLEDFASSILTDGTVVVVNGYIPAINMKSVVFTVADALYEERTGKKASSKSSKSAVDRPSTGNTIDELISYLNNREDNLHVYVIVHNIDGPSFRDDDVQQVLANLAACNHVRFVASMDHINTPLLWDKRMCGTKFNWCWHMTPTYAPYTIETMNLPLILASTGSTRNARSALLVLQSLTPNAQSVFRTLADYQLSHSEDQGLSIHKLYTICRERFLVSSELTLRSHLTEFKDHELVRSRRGPDGQDCLYIPLPSDALTKLLEQIGG